jgi:hypothetical protein
MPLPLQYQELYVAEEGRGNFLEERQTLVFKLLGGC